MHVTLSIGGSSIKLLTEARKQVQRWASTPLNPGLVREGLIIDPPAVAAVIGELVRSVNAAPRRATVSVTGLPFTHRILSLPQVRADQLEEAVLRSSRKEIPLPLEELYLSWRVIASRGDEMDVFVLGASRRPVDAVAETLRQAGIKRSVLDLKPLALARAVQQETALIASLEADSFDVILVAGGNPVVMRSITPRSEGATTEENIQRLAHELTRTVQSHNNAKPTVTIEPETPLVFAGELSTETNAAELLQREVGREVKLLAPALACPEGCPQAEYATNFGLALKHMGKTPGATGARFHDINVDLLAARYRASHRPMRLRQVFVLPAIAVAISLLFPLVQLWNQANTETGRLQAELSRVNQELHLSQLSGNKEKNLEKTISEIQASADTLKAAYQNILAATGGFAETLLLVVGALPPAARVNSVVVDSDRVTLRGEADTPASIIAYATALDATKVFPEVRIAEIGQVTTDDETGATQAPFVIVGTR